MPVNSKFGNIGNSLKTQLPKEMYLYQDVDTDDPLEALVPKQLQYFGVKAFNVFVAQKPYGWKKQPNNKWLFDWPPEGYIQSLSGLFGSKDVYFSSYKTVIFVDLYSANKVKQEFPTSQMPEMMNSTASKLQELCNQNPDSFEFGGLIETDVEVDYFVQRFIDFYGKPAYKITL